MGNVKMNEVTPWVGLGDVRFGESRASLRNRLGEHQTFRRAANQSLIDHYLEAGLMLSFDESDRLNFIECTDWAEPSFSDVQLTGRSLAEILEDLSQSGIDCMLSESSYVLKGFGIYLYTPAPDEPDVEVQGVAVFSRELLREAQTNAESVDPKDSGSAGGDATQSETLF
jgi:hypothetical protein